MARLLVTGASGLLGANIVLEARGQHQVSAVARRRPIRADGVASYTADLTQAGEAGRLVSATAPEWIIHCAAATDLDACERDPDTAFRSNRDMAAGMAAAARACGAAFVHISTDAVFDGIDGGYHEADRAQPVNVYGRSKLEGEAAVLREDPQALVVRTNIFGWNAGDKQSLSEWFLARSEAGMTSPGWTDVSSTPIVVNDLAEILMQLLAAGARGLYHVGGATCLTKFEFGRRIAETFGLDPELIRAARLGEAGLTARRPQRVCLRGDKVEAVIGRRLPDVADGLRRWRGMREDGRLAVLKSMLAARTPSLSRGEE